MGIFGKSFNELGTAVNNAFKSVIDSIDNFDENIGFWESLKNNIAPKNEDGKHWKKNSFGEIISKENIDTYIKKLDLDSAKEKLVDIFDWEDLVKNGDASWSKYFETLKDGEEKYIPNLIKNTDDLSKLTGEDLVKANQSAREAALAHNQALQQQTLGAKATTAATKVLAAAGNILAMWGISEAIQFISDCAAASDKLKETAQELASQFSSTKSDIENYKTQIKDLYQTINDNSSSYEDTYNARQELLSLQDEMIEKFGSEAEAVNLITTAINGQTEALDILTQNEWKELKNNFDNPEQGWSENLSDAWANLWSGSSGNFDRMINEMEDTEVSFVLKNNSFNASDLTEYFKFLDILEKDFNASKRITNTGDIITLSGNLDDIWELQRNIGSQQSKNNIENNSPTGSFT